MRYSITLAFLICLFLAGRSQSYEINTSMTDTINKIDSRNQKQGKWLLRGKHKPGSVFGPEQKIETGNYLNNRKEGVWIEFYPNGKMRNKLTYVNGTLEGPAVFYDQAEKILKEGKFKANKWIQ
jgi:hypothetical protein